MHTWQTGLNEHLEWKSRENFALLPNFQRSFLYMWVLSSFKCQEQVCQNKFWSHPWEGGEYLGVMTSSPRPRMTLRQWMILLRLHKSRPLVIWAIFHIILLTKWASFSLQPSNTHTTYAALCSRIYKFTLHSSEGAQNALRAMDSMCSQQEDVTLSRRAEFHYNRFKCMIFHITNFICNSIWNRIRQQLNYFHCVNVVTYFSNFLITGSGITSLNSCHCMVFLGASNSPNALM